MHMAETFDLHRFVRAQESMYAEVVQELRNGMKLGHWIWFIFPQLEGLGHSWMSQKYAISSKTEAEEYLRHPILGSRLIECTKLVNAVQNRSIEHIFGITDAMKFRSSMTLFAHIAEPVVVFNEALDKYFAGVPDHLSIQMLQHGK
jgi:uncharacterized protein (DUF1810 family)